MQLNTAATTTTIISTTTTTTTNNNNKSFASRQAKGDEAEYDARYLSLNFQLSASEFPG
jgi:hypothetical protein